MLGRKPILSVVVFGARYHNCGSSSFRSGRKKKHVRVIRFLSIAFRHSWGKFFDDLQIVFVDLYAGAYAYSPSGKILRAGRLLLFFLLVGRSNASELYFLSLLFHQQACVIWRHSFREVVAKRKLLTRNIADCWTRATIIVSRRRKATIRIKAMLRCILLYTTDCHSFETILCPF